MDKEIIFSDDLSAAYVKSISAIVTDSVPRFTSVPIKTDDDGKIAKWDANNDFPQKVITDVRKDPEIGTLLNKQARLLYSGGLIWGKIKVMEGGKEIMTPLEDSSNAEIKDWMRKSAIKRYLIEAATDLFWFGNIFPEIVLQADRKKVVQLCVQSAEECRWERQNSKGIVENCYINANFPEGDEKTSQKVPVIDPYYDAAAFLQASTKGFNYIYPLSYPSPGSTYYQLADWNSIRESGWLDVSRAIPKFKKNLLERQMNIKYHVEISDQYWPIKYPNWQSLSVEEKNKIRETELTTFAGIMSGAERAGNSLITAFKTDFGFGKEYSMWKITVIDDKIKQGQFLEEGKDASLYKMSAIGLHPALIGTMPNNGMGGAGSNIREAYNLHMLSIRAHQDIILEPLNDLIKYYNGWDEEVEFRFRNSFMNTLDKGEETTQIKA